MKRLMVTLTVLLASVAALAPAIAAPLVIVESGTSPYIIYHDPAAPKSVRQAAGQIHEVILAATGVSLPVRNVPASPMISVGDNDVARQAGVVPAELPPLGYHLVSKDQDLFIFGEDTPDGKEQWAGLGAQNTLLAAHTFCEKALGARWLFPGPDGEDIPKTDKLVVEEMNLREVPPISYRMLLTERAFNNSPAMNEWRIRNKLTSRGGAMLSWGHSFDDFPRPYGAGLQQLIEQHPEFMPLAKDGTRMKLPSPRGYPQWKYCLSNPELVKAFAAGVIERFDKNPKMLSTSISPTDGQNWCQCENCQKLTLKIPAQWSNLGLNDPQYTPLVLKFYNDVAKRVAEKHPDRLIGAMVYQDYLVPLDQPIEMEKNIMIGIAVNGGYGFKFYQAERFANFEKLFKEWARYRPGLGYTDYSTWMRNWFGFPLPVGRDLMKKEFGLFRESPPKVVHYYGYDAIGIGGAHNYVAAKMMWDPGADPDALFKEYLSRAYGDAAARPLEQLDTLVQESLKSYIVSRPRVDHEIDYDAVKAVYAPIFPQIEDLYFQAVAAPKTDAQAKRLAMLGDNLVQAHYHLRKAELANEPETSRLYKTDAEFHAFLDARRGTASIINIDEWLKTYGHAYKTMPVLVRGWRPR